MSGGDSASEKFACYDAERGLARSYLRRPRTLRGSGQINFSVPSLFGYAVLPSDSHFFFVGTRAIRDYFELHDAEVVTDDGPSPRQLIYCRAPELPGRVQVFVLANEESRVIVEQRSYDKRSSILARVSPQTHVREDFVPPLPLPSGCEDSIVFCARNVLETSSVDGVVIPTKWIMRHCFGSDATVSLIPGTVRINEKVLQEDYLLPFPSGTEVLDRHDGNAYFVDQGGNKRSGEILTNESLAVVFRELGVEGYDHLVRPLRDYVTSCGANSLCVLLAMNDRFAELSDIAEELGVEESGSHQTLVELREAAAKLGLHLSAVSDAQALLYGDPGAQVIAHVKRERRGTVRSHYLVADSYDRETDTLRVVDLPRLPYRVTREVFDRDWTGHALVLGSIASDVVEARGSTMRIFSLLGALMILSGVVLLARRRVRLRGAAANSALCWVALLVGTSGVGCHSERTSRPIDASAIQVVGTSDVDLGPVRWQSGLPPVGHTFVLRNGGKRTVRIADISASCSCLDVQPSTELLEPGGESHVKVLIHATSGSRELVKAFCSVEFDDPSLSPVVLRVKAVVERAYMVIVVPPRWEVPAGRSPTGVIERTFVVREFRHQAQPDALTTIEIEGHLASVEQVGGWKPLGERAYGFGRESRVRISIDVSERKRPFRDSLLLRFRSQVESVAGELVEEEFEAKVKLEA